MTTPTDTTTNSSAIAAVVAAWSPPGGERDDGDRAAAWARELVADAGARHAREARTALRYAFAYAQHLLDQGEALCDDAPTAERVERYRDHVLAGPKGTRDAVASYLKRLHPDIGLAGTTRTAAATDADDLDAPTRRATAAPIEAPALARDVADAIDSFTPTLVAPERWDAVAEWTRDAVRSTRPERPGRARDLCRSAAYAAAFTHSSERPVRNDTVLDAANIEAFARVLAASLPERSVATHASNLHAIRDALGLPLDVPRRSFPATTPKDPYRGDEIDRLFAQAARIPSAGRRRYVDAALHLVLGAGASPSEALDATPEHVTTSPEGVKVRLGDRTVTVLDDYARGLARVVARAVEHDDTHLLGGSTPRRASRFSELFTPRNGTGQWHVDFDSTRGRRTFIVEAALATHRYPSIVAFLDACGLSTLEVLSDLLPELRARHSELAASDTAPRAAGT